VSTSKGDALLTTIRDLARQRGRERRGLALAEGVRLVEEALAAGVPIRGAAVSPALEGTPRGSALKSALAGRGVPLLEVTPGALEALADTEQPQGIVAVIEARGQVLDEIPTAPGAVLLVLDAVQDPGNVGTMLRTALALGASGVVALKGTAELTNPKVLRGSMGAAFRLPAAPAEIAEFLAWARARGVEVIAAAADGTPLERWRRGPAPIAVVVGNEGAGVSPALASAAARRIAIPLASTVESLNVAVAAGILLYEVTRDA
jgi:TrmH family RNA methyltransferase